MCGGLLLHFQEALRVIPVTTPIIRGTARHSTFGSGFKGTTQEATWITRHDLTYSKYLSLGRRQVTRVCCLFCPPT